MSTSDIEGVCSNVETLFKKGWMSRPEEIKQLEDRKGAWGCTLAVHLYCQAETQEIVEQVWSVREAVRSGRLPLDAAVSFLGHELQVKGDKMNHYYKIRELPEVLNQVGSVLPKASSKDEFVKIVDLLLLYAGRYNYWLDADLDWKTLSETHEKLKKEKDE